jgi:hypothetical protein
MHDAAVDTGRAAAIDAAPAGPVYGPAAPTEADCAWATESTTDAMSDPECWFGARQAFAEAEAATYAAAYHLGLDESAPAPPELKVEAPIPYSLTPEAVACLDELAPEAEPEAGL